MLTGTWERRTKGEERNGEKRELAGGSSDYETAKQKLTPPPPPLIPPPSPPQQVRCPSHNLQSLTNMA